MAQPWHDPRPRARTLSPYVVLSVVITPLLAAALLAAFAAWGVYKIDEIAAERERTLLRTAIADRVEDFGKEQESVTVWDEAVIHSRSQDQPWMAENIAEWLHNFYDHDQAVVLDALDRPIHATLDGGVFPADALGRDLADLGPLVGELRRQLSGDPEAALSSQVGDLRHVRGRPSLVSIRPIVPDSGRLRIEPSQAYLHIAVQYLDGALLSAIGDRYKVANVRFEAGDGLDQASSAFPLVDENGARVGYVAWDRDQPGLRLIQETAPGLALFAIVLVGLIRWLLTRLRRAAVKLSASESEAVHLAYHDALPNRTLMNRRLDYALAELRKPGRMVALHYIDLDRFKNVNDTLGHPAGDDLIRQVADRLRDIATGKDLVARLGGDEFAVIQPDLRDPGEADELALRILAAIKLPFVLGGHQAFIDASIGIAIATEATESRPELLRKADIALYEVKANGKGRHCFFEARLDEAVLYKRAIEMDLHVALEKSTGLRVLYQPLFGADGHTLRGAEALVRWDHPTYGMLSPAIFVPIAEERGLIRQLGLWVLEDALRTAKEVGLPSVAVNVSAIQFQDEGFEDQILDRLRDLEVSPERLQIEITEGLLLDAGETIGRALTKLRFAGVSISLDDFGTGYSSLNYLRRYKVDKIKIDQSFVRKLGSPDNTDAIVRAMLDLARALHLNVTAEGVETEQQWEWLVEAGCTEFQGFLFSKPLTKSALRAVCAGSCDVATTEGPKAESRNRLG